MTDDGSRSTVSNTSERRLRDAMARLLTGTAIRTDGRLTKNNLCMEANVSRATMNRAVGVLADWDASVTSRQPRDKATAIQENELAELRTLTRTLQEEVRHLRDQVVAAATVISALHQENLELRDQVPTASLVALTRESRRRRR